MLWILGLLVFVMAHAYSKDTPERSHIPKWDGHPAGFNRYKTEVQMWMMGESLDVPYIVAARLVGALSLSARKASMRLGRETLFPTLEAEDGGTRSARNEAGINALLAHLEQAFVQKRVTRKGELLFGVHWDRQVPSPLNCG